MEYKTDVATESPKIRPRIVIHGGAGNIKRENYTPEKYQAYRSALLTIVNKANEYMNTSLSEKSAQQYCTELKGSKTPSALDVATYAVTLLEDNPLFNSAYGAVFTRDGTNELEASVMVSRGHKKRAVGVMGIRHVRNPILLAKKVLEHGEQDLDPKSHLSSTARHDGDLDIPSAQGHSQICGRAAEQLARRYGLDMVEPEYYFTQQRWDEHVRTLEREKQDLGLGTWDAEEYLPQGTVGAVALDEDGVICVATSTGGMTNKLTGRIGDTPCVGAGFWAEEWAEKKDMTGVSAWEKITQAVQGSSAGISFAGPLKGLLADCLPTPFTYAPLNVDVDAGSSNTVITRSMGVSGTGNGDSFLRTNAVRTVAAMARWKPESTAKALTHVVGPNGELQRSAGERWGRTGEGEGGMIGIQSVVERDAKTGRVLKLRSEVLMDYNSGGMHRAWVDDDGKARMSIWNNGGEDYNYS
ncbi:hypothetical protein QQS21_011529 [Conoideocrella luteorostrata]|uniref:L-asparaginase n=1 Tax=Conoideocrella luteorostrata TaxID=1105319 RepID=A0AAJ0CE13_9HYPO|nr:hypothetical protein QQS21_011529 [Conoideocrella luteorostrata]